MIVLLNWTPIFEWCMVDFVGNDGHQNICAIMRLGYVNNM